MAIDQTRFDPTRTTMLRRAFLVDMERRFGALQKAIINLVVTQDAFDINPDHRPTFNGLVTNKRFQFETDAGKLTAFQDWLQGQFDAGILATTGGLHDQPWTDKYIESAYRKGVVRAYADSNKRTALSGDFYNGTKAQFLHDAFDAPEKKTKIQLLGTRSFEYLKGVTAAMSAQMNAVLADGISNRKGPVAIARDLVAKVDGMGINRARTIARTEVIHAHAEGQLDSFEALGVDELGILAEYSTAGDSAVCPLCSPLEGIVITVKEARGLIPRHPNAVFEGSSFIGYGEIQEIVRARYSGPSVVFSMNGREDRTTIGPNHPVFTARGMICAAKLRKSDYILCDLRHDGAWRFPIFDIDHKQIPFIQDVFQTGLAVGADVPVPPSGSDFHGDVFYCQSEVETIRPARGLLKILDSRGIENFRECDFMGADSDSAFIARCSALGLGFNGVDLAPAGKMGGILPGVFDWFVWRRVQDVSFGWFDGWAFDASTASSLYCSNGVVVSNCRCSWQPANIGEKNPSSKWGKRANVAIDQSLQAERPKDSLKEARRRSLWAGADKTMADPPPPSKEQKDAILQTAKADVAAQKKEFEAGIVPKVITTPKEAAKAIASEVVEWAARMTARGKDMGAPTAAEIEKNWIKLFKSKKAHDKDATAFHELNEELHAVLNAAVMDNKKNSSYQAFVAKNGEPPLVFRRPEKGNHAAAEWRGGIHIYDSPFWKGEGTEELKPGQATAGGMGGYSAVIRHEYGHKLYDDLTAAQQGEWRAMLPDREAISKGVTSYAAKNADEVFCEVFAITTDPRYKPGVFPSWVDDLHSKQKEWCLK